MGTLGRFTQLVWIINSLAQAGLLCLLAFRRNVRAHPAFSAYIAITLAQSGLLFVVYQEWGFLSSTGWRISWVSQSVVLVARACVVGELCHHVLAGFRGIWVLARWILISCGTTVLVYALLAARHEWYLALNSTELGLELATAAVTVMLLVFAKYYEIAVPQAIRLLAAGLAVYSLISVVNDTILERWLTNYGALWNAVSMFSFLGCLLVWTWAFRKTLLRSAAETIYLDRSVYHTVIPEVNWRLRSLDESLIRFWDLEVPRP